MARVYNAIMFVLSSLPWMWLLAAGMAVYLLKTAPTPWHANCINFAFILMWVLDHETQKYVKDVVEALKDRK